MTNTTNMQLIEEAIKLVQKLFKAEGIYEDVDSIRQRATEWQNKTKIKRPTMLAAATITGSYVITFWDELVSWEEFYFPHHVEDDENAWIEAEALKRENFHASEIEAAQRDMIWW